jgi:hypothetical protein
MAIGEKEIDGWMDGWIDLNGKRVSLSLGMGSLMWVDTEEVLAIMVTEGRCGI